MPDPKLSPPADQPPGSGVKYTKAGIVAAAIITIIVLFCVAYSPPLGLRLREGILQQLASMFGFLLMVSLFVERAVEVIISIWSDPEADRLEQERETRIAESARQSDWIDCLYGEKAQTPAPSDDRRKAIEANLKELQDKIRDEQRRVDEIDMELVKYSAHTRKVAAWIGVAIGVLTAGVGFRVLHMLFVEPPPVGMHNALFTVVDVLLTGALLSGGSTAVHHLFSVYNSLMEATVKKAEAAKASAGK